MLILRRLLGVVVIVASVAIVFAIKPSGSVSSDVSSALAAGEANETDAESAPQQQVVNGWTTRDLLAISIKAEDKRAEQQTVLLALIAGSTGLLLILGSIARQPAGPTAFGGGPSAFPHEPVSMDR